MMWLLTIMTDGPTSVYAVQQPMTSALCLHARRLEAERSHDVVVRLELRYACVGSSGLDAAPSWEAMTGGRVPRGSELLAPRTRGKGAGASSGNCARVKGARREAKLWALLVLRAALRCAAL